MIASALCLTVAMPVPGQTPPSGPAASPVRRHPPRPNRSSAGARPVGRTDRVVSGLPAGPGADGVDVPLEIVIAERWVKANPNLKGKALEDALQKQSWDPAVKSLAAFPQVLTMMSEKLDWTQKLGDAFLAQQQDVMATAQALRTKAVGQGTLKDSKEQKVITEVQNNTTIIKIEPANPEVVYVPTYNPTVAYAWYPAYPPYYWYPPGYAYGGALLGFTAGVIIGGALWGNCNWGGGNVNIDVNRYNNFNRTNISTATGGTTSTTAGRCRIATRALRSSMGADSPPMPLRGCVSRPRRCRASVDPAWRGVVARPRGPRSRSRDAGRAGGAAGGRDFGGRDTSGLRTRQRSTAAAVRRRVISATVDRRASGRHALQATSAAAPAEAAGGAEAEADVAAAVADDLHIPTRA